MNIIFFLKKKKETRQQQYWIWNTLDKLTACLIAFLKKWNVGREGRNCCITLFFNWSSYCFYCDIPKRRYEYNLLLLFTLIFIDISDCKKHHKAKVLQKIPIHSPTCNSGLNSLSSGENSAPTIAPNVKSNQISSCPKHGKRKLYTPDWESKTR